MWPIDQLYIDTQLTPNRPLVHTSFTYRKLNLGSFSVLACSLSYVDSPQEVERNSVHAETEIWKDEKTVTIYAKFINQTFLLASSDVALAPL